MVENEKNTKVVYEIMEKRDEEQILQELKGAILKEFVYNFPSKGGTVTGLSWAGVKEAARRMGNIKVVDLQIEDAGDYWIAKAKAIDEVNQLEMWGVSQQKKVMHYKDGSESEDMFALQKCVSKAQRNAIRSLIPEKMIATMIQGFLDRKENEKKQAFTPFGKKKEEVEA